MFKYRTRQRYWSFLWHAMQELELIFSTRIWQCFLFLQSHCLLLLHKKTAWQSGKHLFVFDRREKVKQVWINMRFEHYIPFLNLCPLICIIKGAFMQICRQILGKGMNGKLLFIFHKRVIPWICTRGQKCSSVLCSI